MSVSVFNLISKLFNVPLLNITTSFVAEEQASLDKHNDNSSQVNEGNLLEYLSYCIVLCLGFPGLHFVLFVFVMNILGFLVAKDFQGVLRSKKFLPSVSTSLALAASIGIAEAVALYLGSGTLMNIMGIPAVCQTHKNNFFILNAV